MLQMARHWFAVPTQRLGLNVLCAGGTIFLVAHFICVNGDLDKTSSSTRQSPTLFRYRYDRFTHVVVEVFAIYT